MNPCPYTQWACEPHSDCMTDLMKHDNLPAHIRHSHKKKEYSDRSRPCLHTYLAQPSV